MGPLDEDSDKNPARRRGRNTGRGILLALGVNAAIFTVARFSAGFLGSPWTGFATDLLGISQLVWLVPVAISADSARPRSGLAKGLVIGAAISFVICCGYCCNDFMNGPH